MIAVFTIYIGSLPCLGSLNIDSCKNSSITEVTPEMADSIIKDTSVIILDVRTKDEFKAGHISKAILIPVQELEKRLSDISNYKDKQILVYCRTGNRSKKALSILQENCFTKLIHLQKGITSWIQDGFKIE